MIRALLLLICLLAPSAWAAIEPHEFESEAQTERYQHFTEILRCPKCQNQNLAGSDAAIAADLREELRRLIEEGRTDQEIVDFMVARYGEFVLYQPPLDRRTALLWGAPALFALIGFGVLAVLVRRRRAAEATPADAPLDAAEQARLAALLGDNDDGSGTPR